MILHHKGLKIDETRIKFKKGFKYSNDLSFIPLYYDKKILLIQSPNMYIPFNVKEYADRCKKTYLDLTFQNICDKETEDFLENLDIIFNRVKKNYKNYEINNFIKETNIYKWMRFRLDKQSLFFNQNKEKITEIPSKTFGVFIFSLNGLWLMDNKIWCNWVIIQSKLYIPVKLKEYYFIDKEEENITSTILRPPPPPPPHPPPPPPPPPPPNIKKQNPIKDQILKNKKNSKKKSKKEDSFTPSVSEIMLALKTLNKIS